MDNNQRNKIIPAKISNKTIFPEIIPIMPTTSATHPKTVTTNNKGSDVGSEYTDLDSKRHINIPIQMTNKEVNLTLEKKGS